MNDWLYDANFKEFEKLRSFENQKDFYSDFSLDAANHNYQIFIFSTHKRKNKYVKFFIFENPPRMRPRTSLEVKDFKDIFEFWDNDFRTEKSGFMRYLKKFSFNHF